MQTPHDNSGQIDGKKAGEPFSRSREKVAPQGVETAVFRRATAPDKGRRNFHGPFQALSRKDGRGVEACVNLG
jgi:hypothetical protein